MAADVLVIYLVLPKTKQLLEDWLWIPSDLGLEHSKKDLVFLRKMQILLPVNFFWGFRFPQYEC